MPISKAGKATLEGGEGPCLTIAPFIKSPFLPELQGVRSVDAGRSTFVAFLRQGSLHLDYALRVSGICKIGRSSYRAQYGRLRLPEVHWERFLSVGLYCNLDATR